MPHNFDTPINRRDSDSAKWNWFDPDVLPMWVADMDFQSPEPIIRALRERVDHGVYGYTIDSPELREILVERLRTRHQLEVAPDHLLFLPNLVVGLNIVARAVGERGDSVLLSTPIYFPFLNAIAAQERVVNDVPLAQTRTNGLLHYEIDFDALEAAITPQTKLLMLCNPHNPVGRVFTRAELERLADVCLRHDLIISSDEIHCDLVYQPESHISIASLAPEIAARTVTLLGPSKAFNLPGLGFGAAVVPNDDLRQKIQQIGWSTGEHAYTMGIVAAVAAYRDGQSWLDELVAYLRANRDALVEYVNTHLPDVATTCPEGTFLAWLDCRDLGLENPFQFFLDKARVGLTDGAPFGKGGEGFVRLNFACPRSTLMDGLERMRAALETIN
jgi:cystathionine beta-lyase